MSVNMPALGELLPVRGVRIGTAGAAIKSANRDDVALLVFAPGTSVAGVFTRNAFRAPPVDIAQAHTRAGKVQALLINSGNANAATGLEGREDALLLCSQVASALDLETDQVAPFSTGVIGQRLPVTKISGAITNLIADLQENAWPKLARAIMTTDTAPKGESLQLDVADTRVTITGVAKGAGMIKPDMATMLAYICCDANVSQQCLASMVREVADVSFNRISIDGDTSTNDSFMLAATGAAGGRLVDDPDSADYQTLRGAIGRVAAVLAQRIIRDGEGATKFVTVSVGGGCNKAECLQVAYTIAESPLVKTALFASDPNWGRFCMAIGRAGVPELDQSKVCVYLNELCIVHNGRQHPDYLEQDGARVMKGEELQIRVDLGRGSATAEVWTTDLSYEYVRINAEYRS